VACTGSRSGSPINRRAIGTAALVLVLLVGRGVAESGSQASSVNDLAALLQPAVSDGDFEFFADAVSVRPAADGRTLVRVLVQLPLRAFLEQSKADQAQLRLRVRAFEAQMAMARLSAYADSMAAGGVDSLRSGTDRTAGDLLAQFDLDAPVAAAENQTSIEAPSRDDLGFTDFRVLEVALELPPGDQVLEILAENLSRKKRGLLDRLRNRPLSSVVRILVRVPDLAREPALGDPLFEFGHGERSPYPARLYGLLNDSLHVRTQFFAHGAYDVSWEATSRDGEVAWRDSMRVQAAGQTDLQISTSVNTFPAGQYVLRLALRGEDGLLSASRSFDVAWSLVTWRMSRRDLDLEAELALSEERFDVYRTLPLGEKERYLEDFWKSLDPTPETAENEVLDEFHRRVAYADLNFSETIRGALTDRGRIYVNFGKPDEVQVEVVPGHLAGQGGEDVMAKVDDVYRPVEHEAIDEAGSTIGSSPWDRHQVQTERSRLVGQANEIAGYELWLYTAGGRPLFPEVQAVTMDTGLRILFFDLSGYGQYRLRKSSIRLPIHGLAAEY
jgi:GWxTD domain-containing protein